MSLVELKAERWVVLKSRTVSSGRVRTWLCGGSKFGRAEERALDCTEGLALG